jgi:bacterioferritin-associated ferredoxin
MIVCLCRAACETRVREVISHGAVTIEQITDMCGAGGDCGACCEMLGALIEQSLDSAIPTGGQRER